MWTKRDGCESITRIASQAGYGKCSYLCLLGICLGEEELGTLN